MSATRAGLAFVFILASAVAAPADEFRDLFDGKTLDGWVIDGPKDGKDGKPIWALRDGMIVASGKAFGFLRYDRQTFGDFALRVEYRFAPAATARDRGNSGLGI